MNKQEFLAQLKQGLAGLPQDEADERLTFYSDMIDDRMEEGISEQDAVEAIGPVEAIVAQTAAEIPLAKLVKARIKPRRKLQPWEIVLLVLGAPLWLALVIAAAAVLFAVYVVIWAVTVSLWAVDLALGVSALACVAEAIVLLFRGEGANAAMLFGAGLTLAGLAIFLFFGCLMTSKGVIRLTKKIPVWIRALFIRKENAE